MITFPDNIRKNATAKIIQHLRSLGGAPYLDSFWDEKDFKVKELIEKEAEVALYLFLNHEIQRCSLPNSEEIICLTTLEPKIKNYKVDEIIHLSKELKIDPKFIPSMYQKCQDFLLSQVIISSSITLSILILLLCR